MTSTDLNLPAEPDDADSVFAETEHVARSGPLPEIPFDLEAGALKRLVVSGAAWTIGGKFTGDFLRLAGNLVLTRLLFPEAFGIMLIVNVVLQGLYMFADVGIGPSVIQHKRGDDPDFLNTAWTIQVIRGFALFCGACLLAWPIAAFRHQPMLLSLLPVSALAAVIHGLGSTAPGTLHRHMRIKYLVFLQLSSQVVNVACMILIASFWYSVWSLVIGGLAGALFHLSATHFITRFILRQRFNRFCWDRDALHHLVRFGRWIFISTAFTFLAGQGDKIILGAFFTDRQLGFYGIAFFLGMAFVDAVRQLTSKVLFPAYSRLADSAPERLHAQIRRVRIILLLAALPSLCVVVVWGREIIQILYDPRYHGAGWMLQMIATAGIFEVITITCMPVLLAMGDSFRHMVPMVFRCVLLLVAMLVGNHLAGQQGLVVGVVAASALNYAAVAWAVRKYRAWMPGIDLLALLGCAVFITVGALLNALLNG